MKVLELAEQYEDEIIALRRYFHENPELSNREYNTLAKIAEELRKIGIPFVEVENGGILATLKGARDNGKTVLLRADIDALPVQETEDNLLPGKRSCMSRVPGVMHACGHDAHMAMLLAAARTLGEMRHELPGSVLFVFERGEEVGGKGYLENLLPFIEEKFRVNTCYATHVRWDIPAGKIAIPAGAAMAGAFGFDVTIEGKGGHGSRPDLAVSPVDCFCAIHQQLQALRMRAVAPDQVLTYSLGVVEAGQQANVIPDSLRFAGTVRTFDTARAGECFAREMKGIIEHTCAAYGCTYTLSHFSKPLYEVYNHPAAAEFARQAVVQGVGMGALAACEPWMASESMSAYLKLWPGVLTFTGVCCAEKGCGANHHTPEFDVDESAMAYGAAAAVAYAHAFVTGRPDYDFRRTVVSMEDLVSRSI